MTNLPPVDLNVLPKTYCDRSHAGFSQFQFVMGFSSGVQTFAFSTAPAHFKMIVKMFQSNLEMYEKQFGVIDLSKVDITSPIQLSDLGDIGGKKK